MEACIFNIQRYSLHDGGGIRSIVFFKGCPFHCPWCCNPESLSGSPQLLYKSQLCIKCSLNEQGVCTKDASRCPSGAKSIVGKMMDIDMIMDQALRDKVFYETSNGGVTLSGGEVLSQLPFALALLKALKNESINTAIETTMALKIPDLTTLCQYTDTFLIDMKIIDKTKAHQLLNIDIDIVKANIKKLKALGANIIIRIPLVPEYTLNPDNLDAIIEWLKANALTEVHLLPFHQLGASKYVSLNKDYQLNCLKPPSEETIAKVKLKFDNAGLKTLVGGT